MFTGIIAAVGHIQDRQPKGGDLRLRLNTGKLDLADVQLGDSIAVNGVCLTVVELPGDGFWADVSQETLAHTGIADWSLNQAVNLEKALAVGDRLGGHMVSGHVDGPGTVVDRRDDARSVRFSIRAPQALQRYIARKGSICIDGCSLTVNALDGDCFELNIVPHTLAETIIGQYRPGTQVNLEVDIIARYLERLLPAAANADADASLRNTLHNAGFHL